MSTIFAAFVHAAIRAKSKWSRDEDDEEGWRVRILCEFRHPWLTWEDLISFSRVDTTCHRKFKEYRGVLVEKSIVYSQRLIKKHGKVSSEARFLRLGKMGASFNSSGRLCDYSSGYGTLDLHQHFVLPYVFSPEMSNYMVLTGREGAYFFSADFFDIIARASVYGNEFQKLLIESMKVGADEIFSAFKRIDFDDVDSDSDGE